MSRYTNKFLFLTARPGGGKTAMMMGLLRDRARPHSVPNSNLRQLVIDPTNAYLPFLFQVLPPHVPVIRASPQDPECWAYHAAKDIDSEAMNAAFHKALFPDSLTQKANDPFWVNKGSWVGPSLVRAFRYFRPEAWTLADYVRAFYFPVFLPALLSQCPLTRGTAQHDLAGAHGRGILSTGAAQVNQLAAAVAYTQDATKWFWFSGPGGFLNQNAVLHFGYPPDMMDSLALLANVLIHVTTVYAYPRTTNTTTPSCGATRAGSWPTCRSRASTPATAGPGCRASCRR